MFKLKFKNEFANPSIATIIKNKTLQFISNKTIVSSIYSKYVIIGGGFTGITLAKKLLSPPYKIPNEEITILDSIPEFTNYNKLKYFLNSELRFPQISNLAIEDLLPGGAKFRNYEIFKIDPIEKVIYGENSLRMRYEKLFICAGLEPDYTQVEGLLYALDDGQSNVFSAYHFEKAVSKMSVFTHCLKKRIINFQKLTQRDINFMEHGYGNVVYCCLDNDKRSKKMIERVANQNKNENNRFANNIHNRESENENVKVNCDSDSLIKEKCDNGVKIETDENDKFYNLHLIDEFYSSFFECASNIILLYDLLKKNRKSNEKENYMETVNFSVAVPYSEIFFMENLTLRAEDLQKSVRMEIDIDSTDPAIESMLDTTKQTLTDFIVKELQNRNIKILWGHKLKKITLNNKLWFENGSEMEFNFCYVTPNLTLPSIIKYGILDSKRSNGNEREEVSDSNVNEEYKNKRMNDNDKNKDYKDSKASLKIISEMKFFKFDENLLFEEYVDYGTLRLKPFDDCYIMGDTLKSFYDRQYHNCFLQAHAVANNVKVERNAMKKNLIQEYMNQKSLFFDYDLKHYLFLNNGKIELVKKNFWNNYLVEAFYRENDNKWMLKYLLNKRLGISLKNLK